MNPGKSFDDSRKDLVRFTDSERRAPVINWYRTPVPPDVLRALHRRSNLRGFLQTGGYLGMLLSTGAATLLSAAHGPWPATVLLVFLHGMVAAFLINGVHELSHGTVFRSRRLNRLFASILAFLGWINHEKFEASHARHHRYTLHPPDDLEVVLPIRLMVRHFFKTGFIDSPAAWHTFRETLRTARGRFEGEWENHLFPSSDPGRRVPPVRWARILLAGHGTIAAVSLAMGWWMLPVVTTLAPFYGKWLFFLCNNTQHIGLQDNVPDFRLCCRTFLLNPFLQFLYWHMNFHTEHHMYAAVPCYHLRKLHQEIRHDLPHCPRGLVAVWREIAAIQSRQDKDPSYQHPVDLPETATPAKLYPATDLTPRPRTDAQGSS